MDIYATRATLVLHDMAMLLRDFRSRPRASFDLSSIGRIGDLKGHPEKHEFLMRLSKIIYDYNVAVKLANNETSSAIGRINAMAGMLVTFATLACMAAVVVGGYILFHWWQQPEPESMLAILVLAWVVANIAYVTACVWQVGLQWRGQTIETYKKKPWLDVMGLSKPIRDLFNLIELVQDGELCATETSNPIIVAFIKAYYEPGLGYRDLATDQQFSIDDMLCLVDGANIDSSAQSDGTQRNGATACASGSASGPSAIRLAEKINVLLAPDDVANKNAFDEAYRSLMRFDLALQQQNLSDALRFINDIMTGGGGKQSSPLTKEEIEAIIDKEVVPIFNLDVVSVRDLRLLKTGGDEFVSIKEQAEMVELGETDIMFTTRAGQVGGLRATLGGGSTYQLLPAPPMSAATQRNAQVARVVTDFVGEAEATTTFIHSVTDKVDVTINATIAGDDFMILKAEHLGEPGEQVDQSNSSEAMVFYNNNVYRFRRKPMPRYFDMYLHRACDQANAPACSAISIVMPLQDVFDARNNSNNRVAYLKEIRKLLVQHVSEIYSTHQPVDINLFVELCKTRLVRSSVLPLCDEFNTLVDGILGDVRDIATKSRASGLINNQQQRRNALISKSTFITVVSQLPASQFSVIEANIKKAYDGLCCVQMFFENTKVSNEVIELVIGYKAHSANVVLWYLGVVVNAAFVAAYIAAHAFLVSKKYIDVDATNKCGDDPTSLPSTISVVLQERSNVFLVCAIAIAVMVASTGLKLWYTKRMHVRDISNRNGKTMISAASNAISSCTSSTPNIGSLYDELVVLHRLANNPCTPVNAILPFGPRYPWLAISMYGALAVGCIVMILYAYDGFAVGDRVAMSNRALKLQERLKRFTEVPFGEINMMQERASKNNEKFLCTIRIMGICGMLATTAIYMYTVALESQVADKDMRLTACAGATGI